MSSAELERATSTTETDWTSRLPQTEHVQLFKNTDWASTDLGALETWSPSLRFAASMVFADSRGACVYWGPDRIGFYNEAFMPMAGSAHPVLMGKPFSVAFPELNDAIQPVFNKAESDGMTVDVDNILLFPERNGYPEETYFIGQFIPLRGMSGAVEGIYNTVYESTFRVLHDRRRAVLDRITALPSSSVATVFQHLADALQNDGHDISMMLLYSADVMTDSGTCQLTLKNSIGVPSDHRLAPAHGELRQSKEELFNLFRKAHISESPLIVQTNDQHFQRSGTSMLEGIEWAGFGEQPREIIIAPLANASRLFGFIALGTNPRREYTGPCQQFFVDLIQQLLVKMNSAVSVEDAKMREEALLRDLAERDRRIRHMAMYAPVGMSHVETIGTISWANEQYYDILGLSKEAAASAMSFLDVIHEDDLPEALKLWSKLMEGAPVSCEVRLKRRFDPPSGPPEHACVLVHAFPLKDDGELRYIMSCVTDVSRLKWAESVQSLNAAAAQEAKRYQEDFIDITSHELRNPLGAVMQCAETISNSLLRTETLDTLEIIRDNVDIAETILACANHQKRIIDDVLLLSRLESRMLSIAPVLVNIDSVVTEAERMFRGECKQDNILFTVERHRSLGNHNVTSIRCDPSRLLQVIINILANGVKYVRTESRRELSITYGAAEAVSELRSFNPDIKWYPSHKTSEDLTLSHEWGHGKPVYLFFAIRDSGPGLKPHQIDRLFQRFVQITKRTHIKYGGSGLGLYISRELAEKQGGEIGVASLPGQGATFAFYIKARKTEARVNQSKPLTHRARSLPNAKTVVADPKSSLSVLLTEDNLVNQKFLKRGLETNGCTVHVANHGEEALEFLKKTIYWKGQEEHGLPLDVILMDWEMPVLDGLATTKRIRELEREGTIITTRRQIPIIAITANARTEQIQTAMNTGMNDVLTKPFLVSDMIQKIHQWTTRDSESGKTEGQP